MMTQDTCCSPVPCFKVSNGNLGLGAFKALCEKFVEKTRDEPKCLYYGFSFDGDQAHCRESYEDAEGLLTHLENVDSLLQEALKIADPARLEIHGTEEHVSAELLNGTGMMRAPDPD